MAWPSEAGSIIQPRSRRRRVRGRRPRSRVVSPAAFRGRFFLDARGRYRIFNAAEYRFYRGSTPPDEADTPYDTNATLPHEPTDLFGNQTWYLSLSYSNGVLDSGFLPIGPQGETYLRMEIAAAVHLQNPPAAPADWRIEAAAGGVVRVIGVYFQTGSLRAEQFAINYTTNGSTPTEDGEPPDVTVTIADDGLAAVLSYDLPAQSHGTTVKVRLQTRRQDAAWRWSDGSTVKTITADDSGPAAPGP